MLAATIFWFFLVQMPGDDTWMTTGNFPDKFTCQLFRENFLQHYPNFTAQPCQRAWKEGV